MTLVINATVRDIEVDADGNSIVRLDAVAGQTVFTGQSAGGKPYAPDQISSNTEGKVLAASIILTVEGSEPPMEIGKVLTFNSHFDRTVIPVAAPAETAEPVATDLTGTPATPSSADGTQQPDSATEAIAPVDSAATILVAKAVEAIREGGTVLYLVSTFDGYLLSLSEIPDGVKPAYAVHFKEEDGGRLVFTKIIDGESQPTPFVCGVDTEPSALASALIEELTPAED